MTKKNKSFPSQVEVPEKWSIIRAAWFVLGMILLGLAYVGLVTPGIPFSIPLTFSAICFSKSSKKWHDYLMNHRKFGPFLKNWSQYRIFPKYAKISMVVMMSIMLVLSWAFTQNFVILGWSAFGCAVGIIYGFRYPSTKAEHEMRIASGKKIGWLK